MSERPRVSRFVKGTVVKTLTTRASEIEAAATVVIEGKTVEAVMTVEVAREREWWVQ